MSKPPPNSQKKNNNDGKAKIKSPEPSAAKRNRDSSTSSKGGSKDMKNMKNMNTAQEQMRGQKMVCTCTACSPPDPSQCGTAPKSCTSPCARLGMGGNSCGMGGMGGMKGMSGYTGDGTTGCGGMGVNFMCDELEAIQEEQCPSKCGTEQIDNECDVCNSCPQCNPTDADACGEFFEVMRDSMEDSVKKTLECMFEKYFGNVKQKLLTMASQLEANGCALSKVFEELNDKISYYGERNAQQFQYLCVRMEHDRLFYQQQQEYFMKQSASMNEKKEVCYECRCTAQMQSGNGSGNEMENRHKRGQYWDCTLESADCDEGMPQNDDANDDAMKAKKGAKPPPGKPAAAKPDPKAAAKKK